MRRYLYYICPVALYVWLARRHCERFNLVAMKGNEGMRFVAPELDVWILEKKPDWNLARPAQEAE